MINETTASQPKSIGDDAQFRFMLDQHRASVAFNRDERRDTIIAYLDSKLGAPAAQASATIQAAPVGWRDKLRWSKANPDMHGYIAFTPAQLEHFVSMLCTPAATIKEPVMVAEPVPKIRITLRQALRLVGFFGGHDADVTVAESADGLIAFCTECPEEGSQFLGATEVDDELARIGVAKTPISAHVDLIKAGALRQFKHNDGSPGFVFAYDKAIVDRVLAAPMVADPAGVALSKLCGKLLCLPQVDTGNGIYVSAIAMTGVISEFLDVAATVKAVPSEALDAEDERAALREEQARAVMPLIGPLLDAYEGTDKDELEDLSPDLLRYLGEINRGMEGNFAAPLADKTGGVKPR